MIEDGNWILLTSNIPTRKNRRDLDQAILRASQYHHAKKSSDSGTFPLEFQLNMWKYAMLLHPVETIHYICTQVHSVWLSEKCLVWHNIAQKELPLYHCHLWKSVGPNVKFWYCAPRSNIRTMQWAFLNLMRTNNQNFVCWPFQSSRNVLRHWKSRNLHMKLADLYLQTQ